MIEQLKTIREALLLRDMESCEEALASLTQLEAMVGAQEPFGHYVYFPDQQRGEFAHDLDELCEDMTNDENHEVTPLYTAAPVAQQPQEIEVQCPVCNHKFHEWPNDKQPQAEAVPVVDRVYEAAKRLVDHADFQLGGVLSAKSKARDIPSNAASKVKARHLASLRDALAKAPQQAEAVPPDVVRDAAAYHWLTTTLTSPEPWVVFQKAFGHMTEERPPTKAELDAAIYAAIAQQKGGV